MWVNFVAATFAALVVIFAPGTIALKFMGLKWRKSLCLAPLVSLFSLTVTTEVIARLPFLVHIWTQWLISILVLVGIALFKRRYFSFETMEVRGSTYNWWLIGLYISMGLMCTYYVFLSVIGTPAHFAQSVDMVQHISAIRGFVDSDKLTSFGLSPYLTLNDQAINPFPGGGFYPSAYYTLVAIVECIAYQTIPISINAVNTAFIGVVFPLSVYAFITEVVPKKFYVAFGGAAFVAAFTIFPWGFLIYGPLYPNLAAFCLMMIEAVFLVGMINWKTTLANRAINAVFFVIGGITLLLFHPNAIFTLAVYMMPFCVYSIVSFPLKGVFKRRFLIKLAASILLLVVWIGFFLVMYKTPSVQKAAEFDWGIIYNVEWGIKNILRMAYVGSFYTCPVEYVPALFAVLGIVYTLFRRRWLWMSCSYILICVLMFINNTQSGILKHFIGSFWYTDPYRFGAMASIAVIPLCAFGFAGCIQVTKFIFSKIKSIDGKTAKITVPVLAGFLVYALCWLNYYPESQNITQHEVPILAGAVEFPLGKIKNRITQDFKRHRAYTDTQRQFIRKVMSVIDTEDLIINNPYDGSQFAYGANGLRTYYRYISGYAGEGETKESKVIRQYLNLYAHDPEVQKAVKKIDAHYVLQISDVGAPKNDIRFRGILHITPDTPGFKLVVKDGPYCLYKIDRSITMKADNHD